MTTSDATGARTADAATALRSDDYAVRVDEVPEREWRIWRDLRIDALVDAPYAFGETIERARARTEQEWRSWWQDQAAGLVGPRYIARADGVPAAMASICFPDEFGKEPLLISMWVSPSARGRGLGRLLLDACVEYCLRTGRPRLLLGVVDDNLPARRLYERYGFAYTGSSEPLHSDPTKLVLWMEKAVGARVDG